MQVTSMPLLSVSDITIFAYVNPCFLITPQLLTRA